MKLASIVLPGIPCGTFEPGANAKLDPGGQPGAFV